MKYDLDRTGMKNKIKTAKIACIGMWPLDALPGSATILRVLDCWLNYCFKNVEFTLLRPCVDTTIAAVSLYKDDDLKEVDITLSTDLKDYNIHTSDAMKDFRKQIQEKYVTALVTQLTSRLLDVVELDAFSILDPSKLPQELAEGYTTYGNDHLDLLCSRYGSGHKADISTEELRSEWVAL